MKPRYQYDDENRKEPWQSWPFGLCPRHWTQVVGVVAAVSEGKVDPREYAACGLSCVAETGTAKIPVRWGGDAPKLEQTLRVAGTLSRTDKGLSFVAQELSRP